MTDTKVVSFSKFREGRVEEPGEVQAEAPAKRRTRFRLPKAIWYMILEIVRFGALAGAAWMLFSRPMLLWEYGDWVWVLGWIAYPVIGAWLIAHSMDELHSFLLNCLYFVAGVVLLFYETWLGVVVLLPYVALMWPFSSGRVYVVRPF